MCKHHRYKLKDGRRICSNCLVKQGVETSNKPAAARKRTPEIVPERPEPSQETGAAFSFQALIEEDGQLPFARPPEPAPGDEKRAEVLPEMEGADGEARLKPALKPKESLASELKQRLSPYEEHINERVLTGSGGKATPIWASGLGAALLACLLLLPIFMGIVKGSQPFYSYGVMLLSGGAFLWTAIGMVTGDNASDNRILHIAGMLLGIVACALAFWMRFPAQGV